MIQYLTYGKRNKRDLENENESLNESFENENEDSWLLIVNPLSTFDFTNLYGRFFK